MRGKLNGGGLRRRECIWEKPPTFYIRNLGSYTAMTGYNLGSQMSKVFTFPGGGYGCLEKLREVILIRSKSCFRGI